MDDILALGDVESAKAARTLQLKHPSSQKPLFVSEDKPITVSYVGAESDEFQNANYENRKVLNARALAGEEYDPKVEDDNVVNTLVACTKGWINIPQGWLDGTRDETEAKFSTDGAQKLYTRLSWVRTQMLRAVFKREPFDVAS